MRRVLLSLFCLVVVSPAWAQAPVTYRVSFPEPEHHWMQVEVVFSDLGSAPLQARMSRSSPGRYALHEFAKNVYDVKAFDTSGTALTIERPNPHQWNVTGHPGSVRMTYRVFGDRTDGTFLGIDSTHAHINMPAALMWARGLEGRPARITFEPPARAAWKVGTQLHATSDPYTFTAANLQYLMDSPAELSNFTLRTFRVDSMNVRLVLHHEGSDRDADAFAADLERVVREETAVFGELPAFEGGTYTFLADYLPYAEGDGMEHRNSTIITSSGALRVPEQRFNLTSTAAHEFFHSWNVERIRPRSLEPFNFEDANMSGELWFAEGFTSYYEALILHRAGFAGLSQTAADFGGDVDAVVQSPARRYRSAEDVSRLAPFVDAAVWTDRTNWENTYISYYTWGAALGLGLDLSLRARTNTRVTLDDYMRALWVHYGRPGGPAEGLVGRPYTMQDLRDRLAEISGDRVFAADFFDRYIQGREVPDYETLLARAGLVRRKRNPGRAWIGAVRFAADRRSARVTAPTTVGSPAYEAGIDQEDEIVAVDGEPAASVEALDQILRRHRPGDRLRVSIRRRGASEDVTLIATEDPRLEILPIESAGGHLTAEQRAFRDAWLGSKIR